LPGRIGRGGFWYERYHAKADGTVIAQGPKGYCEYPAILTRIVLGKSRNFQQSGGLSLISAGPFFFAENEKRGPGPKPRSP